MSQQSVGGEEYLRHSLFLEIVEGYLRSHFREGQEGAVEHPALPGGKVVLEDHFHTLAAPRVFPEPVCEIRPEPALTFQRRYCLLLVEDTDSLALRIGLGIEDLHLPAVEHLFHKLQRAYPAGPVIKGAGGMTEAALGGYLPDACDRVVDGLVCCVL